MKKRALLGASALLAAVVMPAASVFAADNGLDYANSIGQVDDADTINYVVEATSDGGYVVGGQTIGCIKYDESMMPSGVLTGSASRLPGEVVSLDECEEYFSQHDDIFDDSYSVIQEVCGSGTEKKLLLTIDGGAKEVDEDGYYDYICIDYIAKFKKTGEREWLKTIDDGDRPVAVGETGTDYRLLTRDDALYTFSKDGEEGLSTYLDDGPGYSAAEFDTDGSIYTVGFGGYIAKYDENARLVATIPERGGIDDVYYSSEKVIMNGDIYTTRTVYDEEANKYTDEVVRISKDLETITTITVSEEERYTEPVSVDSDGNVLVLDCEMVAYGAGEGEAMDASDCVLKSYDKDGNILGELATNSNIDEIGIGGFMEDYIYYASEDDMSVVIKFSKNLTDEPEFAYMFDAGETIHDFTRLNDGSYVGVGYSTESTDNYDIEGSQNGIQMRFGIAEAEGDDDPVTPAEEPKNPSTLDNAQIFAISGAVVLMGAALLTKKMLARR